MARGEIMTGSHTLTATVAVIAAALLAGCAEQPVPTYSYYAVPCPPTAAIGAAPAPDAGPATAGTAPPPASAPPPAAASQPVAPRCFAAVPDEGYAAGYYPYPDYEWPYYYGGIGFGGVVVGDFDHRFHDHDFDHHFHDGFHDHDFHHAFNGHGFHDGGFHGGGFHGGGFHGGGGHGGGRG
jgi:uncharacterized membrane protein YgcG